MGKLTFMQILKLQREFGYSDIQEKINSGLCWKLEGSYGRSAMSLLESGACMLPKTTNIDYYGSKVPNRDVLKAGTKGTFKNSQEFWQKVVDGEYEL